MDFSSGFFIFLYVAVSLYLLICYLNIAKKAGYSYWFGLLVIIPITNFITLGIMAFETWPVLKTTNGYKTEKIAKLKRELEELTDGKETPEEKEQSVKPTTTIEYMRYSPDILSCTTCKYYDLGSFKQGTPWCKSLVGPSIDHGVCYTFKSK
jgi:hypothetical protein